jgi:hypothetical protein
MTRWRDDGSSGYLVGLDCVGRYEKFASLGLRGVCSWS